MANNGWISVEDRLPEDGDGTVLVCSPDIEPYNLKEHFVNAKHDTRVKTAVYSEYSGTWTIGDMGGVSVIWVGYRISNQPIGDRFQNRLRRNEIWHNFIK